MKKLFAFISVLALMSAALFADVSAKKNADGSVAVTFFYGNPRATEVLLAGDFTNWQDGALPMEKGEKGFSITVNFKAGDEGRYKFISDGNWTTDLRAPDFVDDGFGGKNSHIVIADLLGGDEGDSGAAKAKINFISWTMIGMQANYVTSNNNVGTLTTTMDKDGTKISNGKYTLEDKNSKFTAKVYDSNISYTKKTTTNVKKGMDLDSVTVGMKSYNKFAGNFLPNCPLYIEIALAETEMEDYDGNKTEKLNYLFRKDAYGDDAVSIEDGLKNLFSGLAGNPVSYLAQTTDNDSEKNGTGFGAIPGPGSNPFLGHLKFGFTTPYVKYVTGFNYAKPDIRNSITWTTIDGNFDAGYQHVGGFNVFSIGDKVVSFLEEKTGLTFDIGFAPNKMADRKGKKYGYWGWAGIKKDDLVVDFQTNGMYDGDYIFYQPVEHDFILGAKDEFALGDGKLSVAAQGLIATHQKSSEEILDGNTSSTNTTDYFGYSTDVWYRTGDFDGIKNMAGNIKVGYKAEKFGVNAEYRFRGAQASMLYVRENHDDATFDLSEQLGVLNEQKVSVSGFYKPVDGLQLNMGVSAKMPLQTIDENDEFYKAYVGKLTKTEGEITYGRQSWYTSRFGGDNDPLYLKDGGAQWGFKPAVSYSFGNISLGAYADFDYRKYSYTNVLESYDTYEYQKFGRKEITNENGDKETVDDCKWVKVTKQKYKDSDSTYKSALLFGNNYSSTESPFRFKVAGLSANVKLDTDLIKSVGVNYGFDNTNGARLFNTLVGQVNFAKDITATVAFGLKTVNSNDAAENAGYKDRTEIDAAGNITVTEGNADLNNPFGFAVGVSKKFQALKKPVAYAQFVFNMDPFAKFGAGQDQLNMNRSNLNGSCQKEGVGDIDPVDWYEGRAAMRIGIRWDI